MAMHQRLTVMTVIDIALCDQDCDGVSTDLDCDDNDADSTTVLVDADCDDVLTDEDCDDSDPESTVLAEDADCDAVLTVDDCDDNDSTIGSSISDQVTMASQQMRTVMTTTLILRQCPLIKIATGRKPMPV